MPAYPPLARLTPAGPASRRSRALSALVLLALVATTAATFSQSGSQSPFVAAGEDPYPYFDIRTVEDAPIKDKAPAREYLARFAAAPDLADARAAARLAGLAALESAVPGVDVEVHPALKTVEVVSAMPGTDLLTGPSGDRVATLRGFLAAHADAYGVSAGQVADLEVVAEYVNPAGNMGYAEFEQRFNGIPVFQGLLRGGFTAKGELVRTTGVLATGIDASALSSAPSVSAAQAVSAAARNVGWDVPEVALVEQPSETANRVTFARATMADDAKAWLVYFPLADGVARLAWATEIWGSPDAFLTVIDAETGTVLFRKNMTNYQSQPVTYVVYSSDSPAPSSPTPALPGANYQAPFVSRSTFTLIGNEAPNTFNNLGWITDGNNTTDGNNVEAGIDRDGTNGVDAPVTGSGARIFNFGYDPATDDPLTTNYQRGDVTNMFYWTNRFHDATYLLGFTEAARNFQNDNFGRGGAGADRVSAEGQDSSGTNNANFATPADGGRGRMQMYLWTGPTPDRSGDLDQDIILHELTHGLSNRLHNNGSGLGTTMSGGMGEGWSDFYARALLSDATESVNGLYTVGGWATNLAAAGYTDNYYYGIRRFPYALRSVTGGPMNRPHNPLTFADIDPAQINLTDGAYPRGPFGSSSAFVVHNIGEVWASALFEARARFITRQGYATGNQRFLQFVTDGMKLDPVNPTLLQGRDSIIAAASAGGTAADIADIWAGFAVRGMGFSAQVVNAANGTVIEAFDSPGVTSNGGTLVSESIPNGHLDPGELVGVSLCLTNSGASPSGAVTGTLLPGGGVVSPSGPLAYGVINPGANVCATFTFTVSATCGTSVTASLQAQEAGGSTRTLTYPFQVGALASSFAQNFDGVTAPALPAGWTTSTLTGTPNLWVTDTTTPDSAPNRAFAADPSTVSDNVLVSPAIALPAGVSRLTFRNSYLTESTFDGGVLEIAIGGGAFQDIITAGGSFVSNGYNATISTSFNSPIAGRMAWSGNSSGYVTSVVDLPAAAGGQSVVLRWRMATDSSVASTGWAVDTVSIAQFACAGGAVITTPTPGSTLSGASVDFTWSTGTGALQYWLYVGTTGVGSANIWNQDQGTATSRTVTGIPLNGATVSVRLWTRLASGWTSNDYTYTAVNLVKAAITSPTPGSTLAGSSVPFQWTTGSGALQYWLEVGTTGVGSNNIWNQDQGTGTSRTVTGIPTNGATVFVRLWTRFSTGWQFNDYTYTAATAAACYGAAIENPNPGAFLYSSTVPFNWNAGSGNTQYWLYVGTTGVGSANIWNQDQATGLARTVTGVPTGIPVYVRLWSLCNSAWSYRDEVYSPSTVRAHLLSPAPSSVLPGASAAFTWVAGTGSSQYWLYVGSSLGASDIWNQNQGTGLVRTVTGLPVDGRKIYVRLWSLVGAAWYSTDYAFTAAGTERARLLNPLEDSILGGSTTAFNWSAGTSSTQYWLYVGTTGVGSADIWNQDQGTGLARTVTGLPTDHRAVYARLWSLVGGVWVYNDYQFRASDAGTARGRMKFPDNGSTLLGSSTTFRWYPGTAATQYWLYVGTSPGGANLYNANQGTNLAATVPGLPTNGSTVYVRLWTLSGGVWTYNDYDYQAAP
ncbi:MAG: M36 family metallopeptidase [Acidobacteriota bacterium]|nr:M36 family metallopeptidase [Acidobacteriota bacterium]